MRTRPRPPSPRTAIVALALTAVVLSACTSSGAPSAPRARADEPVDEGLEHMLYELLRTELPETIVVSVSHRSTLGDFHAGELELLGGGRWSTTGALTRP